MKTTILTCLLSLLGLNNMTNCNAQNDPFGKNTSNKEYALPPSELPDFETYRTNPRNIKVSSLLSKELSFVLETETKEQITLIDARSEEEYDISHIQNSRRVGYEDFSNERIWMVSRKARVIVYSANNTRSTIVAQYFKLMGFTDVQILEDGLIGWKNEKNDIYDANGKTNKIHIGTKANLRFVKNGLAVY